MLVGSFFWGWVSTTVRVSLDIILGDRLTPLPALSDENHALASSDGRNPRRRRVQSAVLLGLESQANGHAVVLRRGQ